jgi:hypothetical protein
MSSGNTKNQVARDLNEAQFNNRVNSPSLQLKQFWHQDFLESGAQYRMSYAAFLKEKTALWRKQNRKAKSGKAPSLKDAPRTKFGEIKTQSLWQAIGTESTFLSGRFKGEDIGKVFNRTPEYFEWVLENSPKGTVAKQIINFFQKHPDQLK